MNDTLQTPNFQPCGSEKPQRPTFLTVLCVLTFIGSGCSALTMALVGASLPAMREMLATGAFDAYSSLMPTLESQLESYLTVPGYYYLLMFVCYAASVAGAALMWKMKRNGFHLYTIAQCLVLIVGMLINRGAGFPWGGLVWTALWVGGYAMNLKYMRPVEKNR